MGDTNVVDLMLDKAERHIEEIKGYDNKQIIEAITELKQEPQVWNNIASGNRTYLENTLKNPTHNYCEGAKPHLAQALTHRLGFISSKLQKEVFIGDASFDLVMAEKTTLNQLSETGAIQFLRDFVNSAKVEKYASAQINNVKTLRLILEKYDRLHGNDLKAANEYFQEKKGSINNLIINALLPNIMGAIAREKKSFF
jgi:hypothetical protein